MRWSFPLVKIAGIQVTVHLTFFLILLWVAVRVWRITPEIAAIIQAIGFVLTLFICVVMHEFGHALMAKRFGIMTRSITLLPIGGVAAMEKMTENPREEMWVAVAGPLVNIVIAMILWICLSIAGGFPDAASEKMVLSSHFQNTTQFFYSLMVINIVLAVFNMLPAFPMDGGRVLRAVLATSMPYHVATERAATIGQSIAIFMFVLGLLFNPMLMLISAFIWLGAAGESRAEQLQFALRNVALKDVIVDEFHVLSDSDTIADAIDLAIHTEQRYFPVSNNAGDLFVLSQDQLLKLSHVDNQLAMLVEVDLPPLDLMSSSDKLNDIFPRLQKSGGIVGVLEEGKLIGLLTSENLMQWISLSAGS